jgi:hypothetical protein
MNRRSFIATAALALPSMSLLGTSLPTKTYRSEKSVFSNEELTEWCEKNGGHYAQDNELVYATYQNYFGIYRPHTPNAYKDPNKTFRHLIFYIPSHCDKYETLNLWLLQFRHRYGEHRFIIKDIYYPDYVMANPKIKVMPLIASTREYPGVKNYAIGSPIFDIKSRKYVVPILEPEGHIIATYTKFRFA